MSGQQRTRRSLPSVGAAKSGRLSRAAQSAGARSCERRGMTSEVSHCAQLTRRSGAKRRHARTTKRVGLWWRMAESMQKDLFSRTQRREGARSNASARRRARTTRLNFAATGRRARRRGKPLPCLRRAAAAHGSHTRCAAAGPSLTHFTPSSSAGPATLWTGVQGWARRRQVSTPQVILRWTTTRCCPRSPSWATLARSNTSLSSFPRIHASVSIAPAGAASSAAASSPCSAAWEGAAVATSTRT